MFVLAVVDGLFMCLFWLSLIVCLYLALKVLGCFSPSLIVLFSILGWLSFIIDSLFSIL